MRKVYLSDTNKKMAGVFGGLGETYDVDPTLLRILGILLLIITGVFPVVIAYIVAWLVIPHKPTATVEKTDTIE